MASYNIESTPDTTILDAIEFIKTELDGTLTYRHSCRHAICDSCAICLKKLNPTQTISTLLQIARKRQEFEAAHIQRKNTL